MARSTKQSGASARSEINPFRKGGTFEDADASAQLRNFDRNVKAYRSEIKVVEDAAKSAQTKEGKKEALKLLETQTEFIRQKLRENPAGGANWSEIFGSLSTLTDKVEKATGVISGLIPTYSVSSSDRWRDGDTVAVVVKSGVANVVHNLDYDNGELHIKNLKDGFKAHFQLDDDYGSFKKSKLETVKLEKYNADLIDNLEKKHGSVKLYNFDTSSAD